MSYVTSAVMFVSYAPCAVEKRLEEELAFDPRKQSFRKFDYSSAGGLKFMQAEVYGAGFNYIDADALEEWFLALPWGREGAAVLVHESEGDFRRIVPTPGWLRADDY